MAGKKHQQSGREAVLLRALAAAGQFVKEAEEGRNDLIREARSAGATWDDLAEAVGLARETVRKIVGESEVEA